jgi:hypothetical protein
MPTARWKISADAVLGLWWYLFSPEGGVDWPVCYELCRLPSRDQEVLS